MPVRSKDLHGNVPDSAGAALLLIDVVNDFEFEGGDALLQLARGGLIKPDLVVFVTYGH